MSSRETEALEQTISDLTDILFSPSAYREAYRSNIEQDPDSKSSPEIFEVLFKELVSYAEANSTFKNKLVKALKVESSSAAHPAKSQSASPRLTPGIFSPRSSSRPTLRD